MIKLDELERRYLIVKLSAFGWLSSYLKTSLPDYNLNQTDIDIEFYCLPIPQQTKLKLNVYLTLPQKKYPIAEAVINGKTLELERFAKNKLFKGLTGLLDYLTKVLETRNELIRKVKKDDMTLFERLSRIKRIQTITLNGLFEFVKYYALNRYYEMMNGKKLTFDKYVAQLAAYFKNLFIVNPEQKLFWLEFFDNDNSLIDNNVKLYYTLEVQDLLVKANALLKDAKKSELEYIPFTNWIVDTKSDELILGYFYDTEFGFEKNLTLPFREYLNPNYFANLSHLVAGNRIQSKHFQIKSHILQFAKSYYNLANEVNTNINVKSRLTLKTIWSIRNLAFTFNANLT